MYVEAGQNFSEVPSWVFSALRVGYTWDRERAPWNRRVGVISMPCKSVCAPIVALGAIRKDMERSTANNARGHYDALCRAADTHLGGPDSYVVLIDSQSKKATKWKFLEKSEVGIKVVSAAHKETVRKKGKVVPNPNGPVTSFITEWNANQWRVDGDPVVEYAGLDGVLSEDNYKSLPGCSGGISPENLSRSYSGVLLVGGGENKSTAYMSEIYDVAFGEGSKSVTLGDLLTVHASGNMIKRLDFCNQNNIDKQGTDYHLVIADGTHAFSRATQYFRNSDVLGVFSRDEPVDNLASLGEKLAELGRYYKPAVDANNGFESFGSIQFSLMEAG